MIHRISRSRYCDYDYEQWVKYFQENAGRRLQIVFSEEAGLSPEEKQLIFPSMTAFQRGEQSEGTSLQRAAQRFAREQEEPFYPEAVRLFIQEENMHSAYLAQFMAHYGVERRKSIFLDRLFRKFRRGQGIYTEAAVLVTAEMIALSYYTALGKATESEALKSICRQMLHDELPHIVFQSYTLGHDRTLGKGLKRSLLMSVSSVAVWLAYSNLLRAGGYGLIRFLIENHMHLMESKIIASRYRIRHNSRDTVPAGIRT